MKFIMPYKNYKQHFIVRDETAYRKRRALKRVHISTLNDSTHALSIMIFPHNFRMPPSLVHSFNHHRQIGNLITSTFRRQCVGYTVLTYGAEKSNLWS